MGAEKLVRSYIPLPAGELLAHCQDLEIYCKGEVGDYFSFFLSMTGGGDFSFFHHDLYPARIRLFRNVFQESLVVLCCCLQCCGTRTGGTVIF
jgi:hypothetical protein